MITRVLAALVFIGPACLSLAQETSLPTMVKSIRPAVATLTAFDRDGRKLGTGTGFLIASDQVATNCHVIDGAARVSVELGNGFKVDSAGVVGADANRDVAIIRISSPPKLKPIELRAVLPEQGERIVVIGSPLGLADTVSDGVVSKIRSLAPFGEVIQFSAPVSPGNSGGPLLLPTGQAVGVVCFKRIGGENLNFAIPTSALTSLTLHEPRPFLELPPARPPREDIDPAFFTGLSRDSQSLVKRRARNFFRMPDGEFWDGKNYDTFSNALSKSVSRVENYDTVPGPIVGTTTKVLRDSYWTITRSADADAWALQRLASGGRFSVDALRMSDRRRTWTDKPPLWESKGHSPFCWDFCYLNTKKRPSGISGEAKVVRDLGEGVLEVEGHTLDTGSFHAFVKVPVRGAVHDHELVGEFFLVRDDFPIPVAATDARKQNSLPRMTYVRADDLRVTAEELAQVLANDEAELVEWSSERRRDGEVVWTRRVVTLRVESERKGEAGSK